MIRYIDDLYLTEHTKKNLYKIKTKLRLGAGMLSLYVIMLSKNDKDVFDIVPAQMFKIRKYRHMDHTVIGLAENKYQAYSIVGRMVLEHYDRTGKYTDLRSDLIERFNIIKASEDAVGGVLG